MKTKHFFNAVMTALIAVIFSMLAGCATETGGGGSSAGENQAAVKLAADLNAIEEGKATVSGDTVTLIGDVRIENAALTVPLGVTLDLTKETLQLADNAALTVNARAEGVNIDSAAVNPAAINGSGTITLKSK
jgi:Flp pilus assembly protein TadG